MNSVDSFAAAGIDAGNTAADAADEFIIEASGSRCDGFYGDFFISAAAHQDHTVIKLNVGKLLANRLKPQNICFKNCRLLKKMQHWNVLQMLL